METLLSDRKIEKEAILDLDYGSDLNTEPVIAELLTPLLTDANKALSQLINERKLNINYQVFNDLVGWYSKMITRISNSLIIQRYSSYFLTIYPYWRPKDCAAGDCEPGEARNILDEYILWETEYQLLSENGPYPELNRLITLTNVNWLAAVNEFFDRIIKHTVELSDFLGVDNISLDQLTAIKFGISDPHDNGRTAAILNFGYHKVVYKPRSLDGEYGWNYILQHLMNSRLEYQFVLPKILKFDGYGFMEFVNSEPCQKRSEVALCFEKYGALLAIAHAFGTYDLHHENIIVTGDCPVVVDAEPLFRCILENSAAGEQRLKLDRSISLDDIDSSESIMDIGMLPHTLVSLPDKEADKNIDYIAGALYSFGVEPMKDYVPCGRGSNNLQMLEKTFKATAFPNLPVLNTIPQLPKDYIGSIETGFRVAHAFLVKKRQVIIYNDLLFEKLSELKLRLLIRPTLHYGLIFLRSISPQLMSSFEKRKQKIIEDLRLLGKLRLDNINQIETLEVNSILNGDIPRFELTAGSETAYDTPLIFSPLDMGIQRYERLNPEELELQAVTIREKITDSANLLSNSKKKGIAPVSQTNHALEIISSIIETTRWKENTPFWTYTAYAPGYGCTMVHSDPEALYDGVMGTALAIAEAGRLTGNEEWLNIAKAVFNPILKGKTPISISRGGGMARGFGGLIYTMIRIAEATSCFELMEDAAKLTIKHAGSVFKKDELDEVLHGRAGFLLALIALQKRYPSPGLEDIIEKAAQKLTGSAVQHPNGICWKVMDGHSLPNMSHGTSGISMALARWFELSGDPKTRSVLLGAIDYDNSFWDKDESGWVDARVAGLENEQATTWTWCNGRGGGLLSRLAISQALGTEFLDDFTSKAIQAKKSDILVDPSPGLCCGTAGLLDALLKIDEYHSNPVIKENIKQAANLISLHSPTSHYSNLTPALFTGTAGFAFALLRSADPAHVKSVLWFG